MNFSPAWDGEGPWISFFRLVPVYKNDTIIAKPRRLSDPMSEIVISTPKCHFLYLSSLPESEKVPYPDF
jgi:hypothetical protein